ncbi:hypothetical protein SLEP1_g27786 [Rubroshorea leprosula]|uniref:Uncharacterized protein n=1 Tax=Rubroshorea leprosula TaxID=152421 RepID=A0AAV5JYL3_9ROSI|nr:hypothetical protein SLEP1_g27786 [Rubroshorea leprosula]
MLKSAIIKATNYGVPSRGCPRVGSSKKSGGQVSNVAGASHERLVRTELLWSKSRGDELECDRARRPSTRSRRLGRGCSDCSCAPRKAARCVTLDCASGLISRPPSSYFCCLMTSVVTSLLSHDLCRHTSAIS